MHWTCDEEWPQPNWQHIGTGQSWNTLGHKVTAVTAPPQRPYETTHISWNNLNMAVDSFNSIYFQEFPRCLQPFFGCHGELRQECSRWLRMLWRTHTHIVYIWHTHSHTGEKGIRPSGEVEVHRLMCSNLTSRGSKLLQAEQFWYVLICFDTSTAFDLSWFAWIALARTRARTRLPHGKWVSTTPCDGSAMHCRQSLLYPLYTHCIIIYTHYIPIIYPLLYPLYTHYCIHYYTHYIPIIYSSYWQFAQWHMQPSPTVQSSGAKREQARQAHEAQSSDQLYGC